jgi:hypothetical protein
MPSMRMAGLALGASTPPIPSITESVLRLAVGDLLPTGIAWRDEAQFDEGSGTAELLPTLEEDPARVDVAACRARHPGVEPRSAEECRYQRLLVSGVARPEIVLPTVARWARRDAARAVVPDRRRSSRGRTRPAAHAAGVGSASAVGRRSAVIAESIVIAASTQTTTSEEDRNLVLAYVTTAVTSTITGGTRSGNTGA